MSKQGPSRPTRCPMCLHTWKGRTPDRRKTRVTKDSLWKSVIGDRLYPLRVTL